MAIGYRQTCCGLCLDEQHESAMDDRQALSGGNMGGAVRVGSTIRKRTKRQSATIQRLLTHVRARGVTWVPEALGTDEQGRDVWSFIAGEVIHDHPAWLWSIDILTTVARRLRQWHDATASFERRPDDVWWWPGKLPADVICHVDFAPYNHVFRKGEFVGAIDFDICYPGPRLWDLAYTAYRYVPLTPRADEPLNDGSTWDRTPSCGRRSMSGSMPFWTLTPVTPPACGTPPRRSSATYHLA